MVYFEAAKRYPNLHDLGRVMIRQGCWPQEVMSLAQDAIDVAKRKLAIRKGKTRAARRTLSGPAFEQLPSGCLHAISPARLQGSPNRGSRMCCWTPASTSPTVQASRGRHRCFSSNLHRSICRFRWERPWARPTFGSTEPRVSPSSGPSKSSGWRRAFFRPTEAGGALRRPPFNGPKRRVPIRSTWSSTEQHGGSSRLILGLGTNRSFCCFSAREFASRQMWMNTPRNCGIIATTSKAVRCWSRSSTWFRSNAWREGIWRDPGGRNIRGRSFLRHGEIFRICLTPGGKPKQRRYEAMLGALLYEEKVTCRASRNPVGFVQILHKRPATSKGIL